MKYMVRNGTGYVYGIKDNGWPYMTSNVKEAKIFTDFDLVQDVAYFLSEHGFDAHIEIILEKRESCEIRMPI